VIRGHAPAANLTSRHAALIHAGGLLEARDAVPDTDTVALVWDYSERRVRELTLPIDISRHVIPICTGRYGIVVPAPHICFGCIHRPLRGIPASADSVGRMECGAYRKTKVPFSALHGVAACLTTVHDVGIGVVVANLTACIRAWGGGEATCAWDVPERERVLGFIIPWVCALGGMQRPPTQMENGKSISV